MTSSVMHGVVQADREAVAAYWRSAGYYHFAVTAENGEQDSEILVLSFARHRQQATAELVEVAREICAILDAHREPGEEYFPDADSIVNDIEKNGIHEKLTAALSNALTGGVE